VASAVLAVGSGVWACQADERPPLAVDPVISPAEPEGFPIDPDNTPHPSTVSPCGAATVALEFIRPNLYFAIDASGSMLDGIPRGEGASAELIPGDRYGSLALAIQTLLARVGHRVNYGATLFPTGDEACGAGDEILALTPGDTVSFAVTGELGPVLKGLMFSINRRTPRGGTPTAEALRGVLGQLRDRTSESYVFLVTDGGPNCNFSLPCGPDACIPNLERLRLSEEVVCDESLNCCDGRFFGPDSCLDASGSRAAVEALALAGIRTFVIGIPGSEVFGDVLDQLALAGGVARAGTPSYYRISDADELIETVSALGRQVALSCTIELAEVPPDPNLVNLFFDGELIAADPVDGWTFTDERTVHVVGAACELMQTGQVLQADIIAGCPIVIQ
jgi:hypothetical protein